jgi:hypothetical protein
LSILKRVHVSQSMGHVAGERLYRLWFEIVPLFF